MMDSKTAGFDAPELEREAEWVAVDMSEEDKKFAIETVKVATGNNIGSFFYTIFRG